MLVTSLDDRMLLDEEIVNDMMAACGRQIILAVSGGADSMVMLHDIASLKGQWPDKTIMVVYVDHQLNVKSKEWGECVRSAAEQYQLPFTSLTVTVDGKNLEFAARQARYQALVDLGPDAIFLAHHANDRVENFFMKLMRGAGVKGLRSIRPISGCWLDRSVALMRPMLDVSREQIDRYVEDNDIAYVVDPSNQDTRFDRNWIRHVAWPVIQDRYGIADVNVCRSLEFLNEAYELTQDLAKIDHNATFIATGEYDWEKAKALGQIRLKNLIMYILENVMNSETFITQQIIGFASGLIAADMDSRVELRTKHVKLQKIGRKIFVKEVE